MDISAYCERQRRLQRLFAAELRREVAIAAQLFVTAVRV
jgi:hypothetical protein